MIFRIFTVFVLGLFGTAIPIHAEESKPLGIRLEHYEYPFPVEFFNFTAQKQSLEMAYMDVRPAKANGEVVLLLHGKNFCGAYWERTAKDLAERGYRVIIPDQIGFGKSSKPENYHYTFHSLASHTKQLLDELGAEKPHVLGHSMGGMIATRYALMFPSETRSLILENPIGLEDWKTMVPYPGIDQWYEKELQTDADSIRKYQQESYYDGQWKPEYDPWVEILAGIASSEDYPRVAWNQALTYDMIFTQPVVYEFPLVKVPTLLIIGQRDRTALGKASVPEEISAKMGLYPELGKKAAEAIPNSTLVELEGIGHLPHIESYGKFITPLVDFLDR
ncbi:alpha/beta fold hydrolase [Luteolibacter algae]|uniref:Alpha/beta fold hydrolase n=1 Tax=Luteolibacter algae TaxID=454151 RepID=A0ABW5DAG1_9BACT